MNSFKVDCFVYEAHGSSFALQIQMVLDPPFKTMGRCFEFVPSCWCCWICDQKLIRKPKFAPLGDVLGGPWFSILKV